MFTQKEINIVRALIEEEISTSIGFKGSSMADLMDQYLYTLSGIEKKLGRMQNHYASRIDAGQTVSFL